METVKQVALDKAIRLLDSLKLEYVILTPDGDSIVQGDIEVSSKKHKRRKSDVPYGTYSTLFRSHGVDDMDIGDVLTIPCGSFDPLIIRKTLAAHAANKWGGGSVVTSINGNDVEVMRVDNGK